MVSVITFIHWFRRAYYNLHQRVEEPGIESLLLLAEPDKNITTDA
jgi:hypothetical protein